MGLHFTSKRRGVARTIIILAVAAVFGAAPIWSALGASAESHAVKIVEEAQLQTITVSAYSKPTELVRDVYAVTHVEAVGWPTYGNNQHYSDGFGARGGEHQGTDFLPGNRTPVYAAANGVIIKSGLGGSLGYSVTLRHHIDGQTVDTVYGHMTAGSLQVAVGQTVTQGQTLGLVGSTGRSTGPHLHFEVHINGVAVNPLSWLQSHVNAGAWDWMLDK